MTRRTVVGTAVGGAALTVASVVGWILVVQAVGLDQGDKLASVIGLVVSTLIGVAGLIVGIEALRRTPASHPPPGIVVNGHYIRNDLPGGTQYNDFRSIPPR